MADIGIIDLTFILEAEDVLKGEGPSRINRVRSFFVLLLLFIYWGLFWFWIGVLIGVRAFL